MSFANWTGNTLLGQDDYANYAATAARDRYDAAIQNTIRQAGRMGINPSSGSFLNMLHNAQYAKSAGINAAVNDASYRYLTMAQDQLNKDRSFGLNYRNMQNQNDQFWANYQAARDREKAAYAYKIGMYGMM